MSTLLHTYILLIGCLCPIMLFAQKHRKDFEKLGINIDESGNVVWRSKENHRRNNNQLTKEWDDFMSNPENRTEESVMKFRDRMEKKYFNNNTEDLQ